MKTYSSMLWEINWQRILSDRERSTAVLEHVKVWKIEYYCDYFLLLQLYITDIYSFERPNIILNVNHFIVE